MEKGIQLLKTDSGFNISIPKAVSNTETDYFISIVRMLLSRMRHDAQDIEINNCNKGNPLSSYKARYDTVVQAEMVARKIHKTIK
ncbi:MAG: hypothetical protein Q8T08_11780 [Ignavibacteria bacterium]|nr:hypothetical protein [Ignavibacteria bacterium]